MQTLTCAHMNVHLYLSGYLMVLIQQRRRERIVSSHAERDLSVDRPELEDDKGMLKFNKEQRKRVEKDFRDKRNRDQDDREPEHDSSRDFVLQRCPDKRKPSRKVEGFGMSSNFTSYDDKDSLKSECFCH